MGAQATLAQAFLTQGRQNNIGISLLGTISPKMLPPMKAMKTGAKVMTKGALAAALAEEHGLKKTVCSKMLNSISTLATKEVKSTGKFVIHGVRQIKTRSKPATKAGKRIIFGKEVHVKAKPAKTIVKAYPVAALKRSI